MAVNSDGGGSGGGGGAGGTGGSGTGGEVWVKSTRAKQFYTQLRFMNALTDVAELVG